MTNTPKPLTTAEYAKISGMTPSTIARMLREGKLNGEKRGGKWAILVNAEPHFDDTEETQQSVAPPATSTTKVIRYDIATFAKMTYLTENGVRQWLKSGRLTGGANEDGRMEVDAVNLERLEVQHLVRK